MTSSAHSINRSERALKTLEQLTFDNSYARLPTIFCSKHDPSPLESAPLVHISTAAARVIDLDPDGALHDDFVDVISGTQPLAGYEQRLQRKTTSTNEHYAGPAPEAATRLAVSCSS